MLIQFQNRAEGSTRKMTLLHTALVLATVTIIQSTAQECSHYGEIQLSSSDNSVSICLPEALSSESFRMTKICADGWTLTHARLACRQLNLGYQGVTFTNVSVGPNTSCVSLPGCRGTETSLSECNEGNQTIATGLTSTEIAGVVCKCVNGDIRSQANTIQAAEVQFCYGEIWRSICNDNKWKQDEKNIVCNQLGYSNSLTGANEDFVCQTPDSNQYITDVDCKDTDMLLGECTKKTPEDCDSTCGEKKAFRKHSTVVCQSANCTNGEVRLVGGSTNREGRVEVCVDGRWGTVCNNNPELASAVCSQLRYPAEGSISRTYPPGIVPVYSCNLNLGTGLNCTLNDVTCDHSRDLGIQCLSREELDQVLRSNNLSTSCPETTPRTCPTTSSEATHDNDTTTCPPAPPCICVNTSYPTVASKPTTETTQKDDSTTITETPPCTCKDTPCPTTTTEPKSEMFSTKSDDTTDWPPKITCLCETTSQTSVLDTDPSTPVSNTTSNDQQSTKESQEQTCVSASVLGGVVGVLVTVLVVLVIGWSLSCVALVKRNSHKHKKSQFTGSCNKENSTGRQLDNPVYDANMETHNYSSSGPTYELVDTNEGAGPIYSVLEQHQESRTVMANTTTEVEEGPNHALESDEGATGGACDYEVPVPGQTLSRVWLCEEEYSTLKH